MQSSTYIPAVVKLISQTRDNPIFATSIKKSLFTLHERSERFYSGQKYYHERT
jgi:hypothetical protein